MALSAADVAIILKATDELTPVLRSTSAQLGKLQSAVGGPTKALGGLGSAMGKLAAPARGIGGLVEGLGKLGFAGFGVSALGNAFSGLAGDAIEAQKVTAQTNAVIASTRGVAGLSADEVAALATSFSKMTPFEDEAIQSAENMLLTFTNIGKDVFPGATEAVLNMSTALGQDTKESAIQLGKALNDPVQGATALRRVGVALTDAQQEQIAAFVKSGDVMSAQGVILNELQTEFGGAARAAGETFGGKLAILNTQLGNLKEAAFTPLLGVVGDFATALADFVSNEEFTSWVSDVASSIGGTLSKAAKIAGSAFTGLQALIAAFTTDAGAMGIVLDKVRDIFGDTVADAIEPFVQAFMDVIPEIKHFVDAVGYVLDVLGDIFRSVFSGDVEDALGLFQNELREVLDNLGEILGQWGQAFLKWIGPIIPPLLAQLGEVAREVLGWIVGTALPAIVKQLAEWARAFLEWVVPLIPPLLIELGKLLLALTGWIIRTAVPAIAEALVEWGQEFVAWVGPMIPPLLVELGKMMLSLLGWVKDRIPDIIEGLASWVGAFVRWVIDVAQSLPTELPKIIATVTAWITGEGSTQMRSSAADLGAAMVSGVVDGLKALPGAISSALGSAWDSAKKGFMSGFEGQRGAATGGTGGFLTIPQFGSAIRALGFNEDTIAAICGPIAATGLANGIGKGVSLIDVEDIARRIGAYARGAGTFGPAAFQRILSAIGIDSRSGGFQDAVEAAMRGIPVAISTPLHYFLAQGFDQATQQFIVGNTGTALRAGAEKMTRSAIEAIAGPVQSYLIPTLQRGAQIAVDSSISMQQAFSDAASVVQSQFSGLGEAVSTSLQDAFGGNTDVAIERLSTLAERAGTSLGAARAAAIATGTDLKTYLEDLAAPAVQAVTDRIATLSERAGIDLGVARAEAAAAGVSLKAYLEEMAAPAADALSTSLDQTAVEALDLDRPLTDVRDATRSLAVDGFDVGADAATQISFVLQQLSDKMPALIQQIKDFVAALMTIPTDINVNISTNTDNGGGGGGGGGQPQSGDRIGDTPSNQSERADLRNAGFYVDDSGVYKLAKGGIIQRPTLAMMGEHGREAVVPLSGGGITLNMDTIRALADAIAERVPTYVTVEDIHTGLLKKAARNNSLGLA